MEGAGGGRKAGGGGGKEEMEEKEASKGMGVHVCLFPRFPRFCRFLGSTLHVNVAWSVSSW